MTITDTVGFIQKFPTTLIEAFKSTLDEITRSDLILHVVDASSPECEAQMRPVQDVLGQIKAAHGIIRVRYSIKSTCLTPRQKKRLPAAILLPYLYQPRKGRGLMS